MIVVPTEKQFDWRHAPIVLFFIVLLNVLVFFLYQSGDIQKHMDALSKYQQADYFELEWPVFKQYLQDQGDTKTLEDVSSRYEKEELQYLNVQILMRNDFYLYLSEIAPDTFEPDIYAQWHGDRARIQAQFNAISAFAYGLTPSRFRISALLTHQFLHGGVMHLLGNMFFLVICGFAVEAAIGHWRFLGFYLVGGIAAGLAQAVSDWQSSVPLVGASGAISAVMAMYLAIFRLKKIEFFYWIFFFVGYFRAPALLILPFYIGKELYSYHTAAAESNVAFLAHAGGFVAGGILIGLSLLLDKKTVNVAYIENDQGPIDEQRQHLAEIYRAVEKYSFSDAFKRVNEAIKAYGLTFELAMIRYNLLKISKGKGYPQSALQLWTMKRLLPHELERLENVWIENPELQEKLNNEQAVDLGMQLSTLQNPVVAEQLFELLQQRQYHDQSLTLLAQKLSSAFEQLGESNKQSQYHAAAVQLMQGGHRGLL